MVPPKTAAKTTTAAGEEKSLANAHALVLWVHGSNSRATSMT